MHTVAHRYGPLRAVTHLLDGRDLELREAQQRRRGVERLEEGEGAERACEDHLRRCEAWRGARGVASGG